MAITQATTLAPPAPIAVNPPDVPRADRDDGPPAVRRLLVIDAMRAIAALSVLAHHLPPFTGPFLILRPWQAMGFIGVGMFLVLSGFSIHYKWAATRAGGTFEQRVFWRRRFFRLVPSYWAAAAIAVAVAAAIGILVQPTAPWGGLTPWTLAWMSQLVVVTANFIPVPALWVTWTIALELQLYAAYALVVKFVRRFDPVKIVLWCLALTLLWRFGAQAIITTVPAGGFLPDGSSPLESRALYGQMPARAFEWFLGMLAAEMYFGNVKTPRWSRSLIAGCVLLLASTAVVKIPLIELSLNGNPFFLTDVLFDLMIGLTFFLMLNWAVRNEDSKLLHSWSGRPLNFMAFLGLFSYSIYLIHATVIELWDHYVGINNNLLICAEGVVAVAVSWVFFHAVEKRFLYRR